MATQATIPSAGLMMPTPAMPPERVQQEATVDDPQQARRAQEKDDQEEEQENKDLLEIRRAYKASWATKRQFVIRRILRAFEYLKNNPYGVLNPGTNEMMNPIAAVMNGESAPNDAKLFEYNDNIYQMLCLSFMAALSPDVSKTRWMPDDPQNEEDLAYAKKASTMEAFIERMNDMPSIQLRKLLYLWCCGTYFVYARNVVDAVRAGTTKVPVMSMQDTEVAPNRYLCPGCGTANPEAQSNPFTSKACASCGTALNDSHFYPAESMPMPVQTDTEEQPNSMTALDIECALTVDCDPDAQEIAKTPLLDYVGELTVAAIRACYPDFYEKIHAGEYGDDNGITNERLARERVYSPASSGALAMQSSDQRGTFSRCWIQPWAFNMLNDEKRAKALLKKYPKGVKLVSFGQDLVLEKQPEALNEHWNECRTIKGMGMFPFGVGDVALSVQDRVDDTANNIHIYQDTLAQPPLLYNAALIDDQRMNQVRLGGGQAIGVYPSQKMPGQRWSIQEAIFQPNFHVDSQIYSYSTSLMTLMQLLTGVQPQIFGGGTTRGVDTMGGQEQQLNTAMGRLMMFLTQMRSEQARSAKIAVKCMAADIDDQARIVIEGDTEGEYENMFILQSEVQGEIHGFPQTDQGFPASYGEMRDRMIQLLDMVEKNPVLQTMLSDPDMQKLMALYILPPGAPLPGDEERTKVKLQLQQLSKSQPTVGPDGQTIVPSILPDPDFDDMGMIVMEAKKWAQRNYEMATSNPPGYENVRAYFKMAGQMQAMAKAKQAANAAAAQGAGAPPQQGVAA